MAGLQARVSALLPKSQRALRSESTVEEIAVTDPNGKWGLSAERGLSCCLLGRSVGPRLIPPHELTRRTQILKKLGRDFVEALANAGWRGWIVCDLGGAIHCNVRKDF